MTPPATIARNRTSPGFTLVELLAVVAIVGVLLAVGASMMSNSPAQARKAGMDVLQATIEQARTQAITKRSHTVLAIVNPGDSPGSDPRSQRLGLFEVLDWPEDDLVNVTQLDVRQLGRWRTFEPGLMLIDGVPASGLPNPMDAPPMQLNIAHAAGAGQSLEARVLVFHPRGGIRLPVGSEPVSLRLAEASFRDGTMVPRSRDGAIAESSLQIGRVVARPYRNDG